MVLYAHGSLNVKEWWCYGPIWFKVVWSQVETLIQISSRFNIPLRLDGRNRDAFWLDEVIDLSGCYARVRQGDAGRD